MTCTDAREQQRVASGAALATRVAPTMPSAAGSILDDEVLAHRLVELLDQDARDAVEPIRQPETAPPPSRAGRIIVRVRSRSGGPDERQRQRRL